MAIDFSKYRKNEIDKKLDKARYYPLDIMVTGVTGAGKSTTLNTLFNKDISEVGDGVDPKTMKIKSYSLNDYFRVWDTPGLGDGVEIDNIHKKKLVDLLYEKYSLDNNTYAVIDMAIVVIEGANRDMGTTYTLLNEVIVPNIQSNRIFVIINQADVAMKGRNWDRERNRPNEKLIKFLDNQAISIQKRVKEATGVEILRPVYYSAEYGYNVKEVFDFIIENIPNKRRNLMQ